jgi:thioredoxin family protein
VRVEVLIASCCTPLDVQKKIVSILQDMKGQVPDLDWNVLDITKEPELAVSYKAPMTPAIYIDGKLEFMGYPKRSILESKIQALNQSRPAR